MLVDEEIGLTLIAEVPGHHRAYVAMPPETLARLGQRKAVAAMRNAVANELARRGWPTHGRAAWFVGEVDDWTTVKLT